ncbi:HNH endonuclease signature motif containing protein [Branchiibius cervicis]|uniref:HNH endonuclease signature motif containing protein n=1 Tax=Branchiibius cervicis TaxID=908252 RepID=A0ABW2AT97_9MICO
MRAPWCDLHHLIAWAKGGRTDLANCGLLCRRHHTLVHEQELTATVTAMGVRWNLRP